MNVLGNAAKFLYSKIASLINDLKFVRTHKWRNDVFNIQKSQAASTDSTLFIINPSPWLNRV
jgi:hypothetical protein